jgi:hypothetical protein
MAEPLIVSDIRRAAVSDSDVATSACIDGCRIWYRAPEHLFAALSATPFVMAALPLAMKAGRRLVVESDLPVCDWFAGAVPELEAVYMGWFSAEMQQVACDFNTGPDVNRLLGTASFFSGGVDGTYTALSRRGGIDALLFVAGIDIQLDNQPLLDQAVSANRRYAESIDTQLHVIASNVRDLVRIHRMSWPYRYGIAGLASIAALLGFSRVLVAADHTYAVLDPAGIHPLLNPMYSTRNLRLLNDGGVPRLDKLRAIARDPDALDLLRVCWHDSGYNCGTCEKCLRTRTGLTLLGVRSPTLAPIDDWTVLRSVRLWRDQTVEFWQELGQLAREQRNAAALREIRRIVRRRRIRSTVSSLGKAARELRTV